MSVDPNDALIFPRQQRGVHPHPAPVPEEGLRQAADRLQLRALQDGAVHGLAGKAALRPRQAQLQVLLVMGKALGKR